MLLYLVCNYSAELGGRETAELKFSTLGLPPSCNTQPFSSLQVLFPTTIQLAILFQVNRIFGRSTGKCISYTPEARKQTIIYISSSECRIKAIIVISYNS